MSGPAPELNLRERELLEFASAGARDEEIAAALAWPLEEVGPRLDRLAAKLGLDGREDLVGHRLPEVERPVVVDAAEERSVGRASWDAGHHEPEQRGGFPWQAVAGLAAVVLVGVLTFVVMTSGDDGTPAQVQPTPTAPEPTSRPAVPTATLAPLTVGEMLVGDATLGGEFDAPAFEVVGLAWCEACEYAPSALVRVWREDGGEVQAELLFQFTEEEPGTVGVDRRDGTLFLSVQGTDGWTRFLRSADGGATWEEELRLVGQFGIHGPTLIWGEGIAPSDEWVNGYATFPDIEPLTQGTGMQYLGMDGEARPLWVAPGVTEAEGVWLVPGDTPPAFEVPRPIRGQFSARVRYGLVGMVGDPGTSDLLATWILFGQAGPVSQSVLVLLEDGEVVKAVSAAMFPSVLEGRWAFGTASYQSFGQQVEFLAALDLESGAMQRVPLPWPAGEVTGLFAVDVRVGE